MVDLPTILPGHWGTPASAVIVARCVDQTRADLCMGDRPDLGLANAIFLIDRHSLDLLPLQTAAKERIRWLSVQLALANAAKADLLEACQFALDLPGLIAEYRSRPENSTGAGSEIDSVLDALRAAIAKATGAA